MELANRKTPKTGNNKAEGLDIGSVLWGGSLTVAEEGIGNKKGKSV